MFLDILFLFLLNCSVFKADAAFNVFYLYMFAVQSDEISPFQCSNHSQADLVKMYSGLVTRVCKLDSIVQVINI